MALPCARRLLIGLLGLFADEWPRSSPAMLRKGEPASFRLFPVGSYVVVYSAGSFLPTLVGLLKAIRWCGCHHASRAVSTPSTNALASDSLSAGGQDSLSAGGPLGLIGGFGLPSFCCCHGQRFSTSRRRLSITKWAISSVNRRILSSSSTRDRYRGTDRRHLLLEAEAFGQGHRAANFAPPVRRGCKP